MKALAGCACSNDRQYLPQVQSVPGDIFNKEPQEGSAHVAASQRNGPQGTRSVLTSVRVSLLCPDRTGSEGNLSLHGGLCLPFLPQ